jgi:NAD(P)H dehydrogenase (quinone)
MQILIILAHPDPDSLNHAIAHAVKDDLLGAGHSILFHDLYKEEFAPLLIAEELPESGKSNQQVEAHCHELSSADGIVIIHPN